MENQQLVQLIRQELPGILQRDRKMREWVLRLTRERYADKDETESRFDRLPEELCRGREERTRKWEEKTTLGWRASYASFGNKSPAKERHERLGGRDGNGSL